MEALIVTADHNGYQRGDIIAVMPDGHSWGLEEDIDAWTAAGRDAADFPNPFAIVTLPGYPPDLDLMDPIEELVEDENPDRPPDAEVVTKASWRVNVAALALPDGVKGGRVQATRALITRHGDNVQLPLTLSTDQTRGRALVPGIRKPKGPVRKRRRG